MLTLVIPAYSAGPNIERTIQSCAGISDETIIISTAIFAADLEQFHALTPKVVELPWNFVFLHGFGSLSNQGTEQAKNPWLLLLGVAETFAHQHKDVRMMLKRAAENAVFRCDHHNDKHTWKRIWNRYGPCQWSGIIHEEIVFGHDSGLLFRMQDTDKTPREDGFENEVLRYLKTLSYNWLYSELLRHPERLGGASSGWLAFVNGAKESITAFCEEHADLLECCISGDREGFLERAGARLLAGEAAKGVNFNPQGEPMTV